MSDTIGSCIFHEKDGQIVDAVISDSGHVLYSCRGCDRKWSDQLQPQVVIPSPQLKAMVKILNNVKFQSTGVRALRGTARRARAKPER